MPAKLDFTNGNFRSGLRSLIAEIDTLGPIPDRVSDYLLKRGDVDPMQATDDIVGLKDRMSSYLKDRGVRLDDDERFRYGGYDEILYSAYDRSLSGQRGGDDPVVAVFTGSEINDWDYSVDRFDGTTSQGIDPLSVRAAGAIDYVYELGERMGVFRLAEALVLNWASGRVEVVDPRATTKLYAYWKQLDDRSDAQERGMLYRRVLGKGSTELLSRMVSNDGFMPLWSNLMGEAATFIDKSERLDKAYGETMVSSNPIRQCMRELQYNLTEYCNGMAFVHSHEVYRQLQAAFEVLKDPDIVANFGGPRRRNMWTVVERLSKEEFGQSVPVGPLLRVAVDGNRIFQLVANFDGELSGEELASLVDAAESYILNSSVIDSYPAMARESDTGTDEDADGDEFSDDAFHEEFGEI
jgi:hypothetical protein